MGNDDDQSSDLGHRKQRKRKARHRNHSSSDESSSSSYERRKKSNKRSKRSKKKKEKKRRRGGRYDSSSSESSSSSDASTSSENNQHLNKKVVVNERLRAKLEARGETLEERRERRSQKRAAHIASAFGYTADDNPFHDPNLHETFTWKKKAGGEAKAIKIDETLAEIEKVRQRRKDREDQMLEMERIRAEECRMRELENAEEWERKEEQFHLHQQRQRTAIRLVEGRERPIDVLAKNMLIFGLSEQEKRDRVAVKYKEKFNAMDAVEYLEVELEEPYHLLQKLKLEELEELLLDIDAFRSLEANALGGTGEARSDLQSNPVLRYWAALEIIVRDEIAFLKTGGTLGSHASMVRDVQKIFVGQSLADLSKMQHEVVERIRQHAAEADFNVTYWKSVLEQIRVHEAKVELSEMHSNMLARQLHHLEKKRAETDSGVLLVGGPIDVPAERQEPGESRTEGLGDTEEELDAADELQLTGKQYSWQDKYRPRKPRYFNRVRTGYDWNKYNQVHFDKENPPPKIVQGYKFNIFYPDLIDPSKTPTFFLERADSDDFCIIRFHAGPPYEDVAFKIINREWNRSRKRGYKCTFERGVLSLYFNFKTHWYRR